MSGKRPAGSERQVTAGWLTMNARSQPASRAAVRLERRTGRLAVVCQVGGSVGMTAVSCRCVWDGTVAHTAGWSTGGQLAWVGWLFCTAGQVGTLFTNWGRGWSVRRPGTPSHAGASYCAFLNGAAHEHEPFPREPVLVFQSQRPELGSLHLPCPGVVGHLAHELPVPARSAETGCANLDVVVLHHHIRH